MVLVIKINVKPVSSLAPFFYLCVTGDLDLNFLFFKKHL